MLSTTSSLSCSQGEVLYRVRWKNYCSDDDTWEPEAHLEDCREVLLAFKKSQAEAKAKKEAETKKCVVSLIFQAIRQGHYLQGHEALPTHQAANTFFCTPNYVGLGWSCCTDVALRMLNPKLRPWVSV